MTINDKKNNLHFEEEVDEVEDKLKTKITNISELEKVDDFVQHHKDMFNYYSELYSEIHKKLSKKAIYQEDYLSLIKKVNKFYNLILKSDDFKEFLPFFHCL